MKKEKPPYAVGFRNCISPDEAVRRAYARHTTEGARARNSQVTELIADGTLESCIRSAEEAIPAAGRIFQVMKQSAPVPARSVFLREEKKA